MARLTSILLLTTGLLLLVTWLASSVSSAPPREPSRLPAVPRMAELETIDREIERLSERLTVPVAGPVPERDPFQFKPSSATRFGEPELPRDVVAPAESLVVWPRLVAILSSGSDAAPARRAVLEDVNGIVQIRSEGETIDRFTVVGIAADSVVVALPDNDRSTRLSIR